MSFPKSSAASPRHAADVDVAEREPRAAELLEQIEDVSRSRNALKEWRERACPGIVRYLLSALARLAVRESSRHSWLCERTADS